MTTQPTPSARPATRRHPGSPHRLRWRPRSRPTHRFHIGDLCTLLESLSRRVRGRRRLPRLPVQRRGPRGPEPAQRRAVHLRTRSRSRDPARRPAARRADASAPRILHDVIEDTADAQGRDRRAASARDVAELVDGVSKLDQIEFRTAGGGAGGELPQDAARDGRATSASS
ncbi:MAG: hypothetical protein MZV65_13295 [Chromatiales bacterium]|nr:hypothetical protein [Chromatiales bacterium]